MVMVMRPGEERGINVENVVHIKAAEIQNLLHGNVPHVHLFNRHPGVDGDDAFTEFRKVFVRHQIRLAYENTIRKTNLILTFGLGVESFVPVLRVHDRHDAVQTVVRRYGVVHEERLADGAGVGDPRRFNDDVVKIDFALGAAQPQIRENPRQVAAYRAADAAVIDRLDLLLAVVHEKFVVDPLFAEFVFNDGDLVFVVFRQNAV